MSGVVVILFPRLQFKFDFQTGCNFGNSYDTLMAFFSLFLFLVLSFVLAVFWPFFSFFGHWSGIFSPDRPFFPIGTSAAPVGRVPRSSHSRSRDWPRCSRGQRPTTPDSHAVGGLREVHGARRRPVGVDRSAGLTGEVPFFLAPARRLRIPRAASIAGHGLRFGNWRFITQRPSWQAAWPELGSPHPTLLARGGCCSSSRSFSRRLRLVRRRWSSFSRGLLWSSRSASPSGVFAVDVSRGFLHVIAWGSDSDYVGMTRNSGRR